MFSARPCNETADASISPRILAQVAKKAMSQIALALAGMAMLAAPAIGADGIEGIDYKVSIVAPSSVEKLLEDNLDLMRFRGNAHIDKEQLARLVRAAPDQVKTLVATAGFYTPQVSAQIDSGTGTPTVVVTVESGEPVLVGSVDVQLQGFGKQGDSAAAVAAPAAAEPFDANGLKAGWSLKEGQVFRQADWELAKRNLLRQVVQTRYPRAQLSESLATVDPETHRAALRVVLDSGPEMRFGALRIEGLKRYPATIVRNLNPIKPGDYYNEAALQSYQSRLQDTGYFSSVEVSADLSGVLEQQIGAPATAAPAGMAPLPPLPLLVRVTESKLKNVSAGLGYSTNTRNRAQLSFDDLNLFGLKFKSALTLETLRQTAHGDFYFPTTAQGYNDSIGASFERNDIEGETTSVSKVAAKRAWGSPLLERSLTLEFLKEVQSVAGVPKTQSKSLPLTWGITMRRLDNLLFPTRGFVFSTQLGAAPLPILTDEAFVRAATRVVYYHPLGKHGIAILRAEGGALASKEKAGVPDVYLFRAGGDQSVRGYAYQELGVQEGTATVGGRYLATGSAEYQYWLTPTWGAATFYDAGNAADTFRHLHPKSGYGIGVRYKSPVGPINVDVAYGHAVQKYRLHFSLGFTF